MTEREQPISFTQRIATDTPKTLYQQYNWREEYTPHESGHYPYAEIDLPEKEAYALASKLGSIGIASIPSPTHPADHTVTLRVEGHTEMDMLRAGKPAKEWAADTIRKCRTNVPTEFSAQKLWPGREKMRNHLLHDAIKVLGIPYEHQKSGDRDVYVLPAEHAEQFAPRFTEHAQRTSAEMSPAK